MASPPVMQSAIDVITRTQARGWAWLPTQPAARVEIEAVANGRTIGRATASELRIDLAAATSGSGRVGFTMTFTEPLADGAVPQFIGSASGIREALTGGQNARAGIYADSITRWGITGWAWVPCAPELAVTVEAIRDGAVVGHAIANELRPDLAETGIGTGRYGYSIALAPAAHGGGVLKLRVIGPNGVIELPCSEILDLEGNVESITRWGAMGWAWAPEDPSQAVEVEAVLGDRTIARTTANQLREDLAASGRGSGCYGFILGFEAPLDADHIPQILAQWNGKAKTLPAPARLSPDTHQAAAAPKIEAPAPQQSTGAFSLAVEGAVDSLTRWGVTGWAWTPAKPEEAVVIEAVLGGRVIGRVTAEQLRPDLFEHGKGSGKYGFVMAFNEPISGQEAPIVRIAGLEGPTVLQSPTQLPPEELTPAPPPTPTVVAAAEPQAPAPAQPQTTAPHAADFEGYVDYLTRTEAIGWAWMPGDPGQAVLVEAVQDGIVIGRTIANQPRPDLQKYGKGTGLYGFKLKFEEPVIGTDPPAFRALAHLDKPLQLSAALPPANPADRVRRPPGTLAGFVADHAKFTAAGPEFEEFDPDILAKAPMPEGTPNPLLMAFYLPQFHPIPENDRFWGKGFTEWRQLPRGIPRFPGHYQPRIPRDLGFYNLNHVDVLERQASMAKAAGVSAFAYYYYWFNRKRVLEKPLNMHLQSAVDMPFLIIWANENWTRTWDGSESQVLLRQDYRSEDEAAFLFDLARHFVDPRYVRIQGRPLFVIYNPKNIPEARETIARWRQKLAEIIGIEPLLFMAQTFGERDPGPYGLDGAMEFPPHKLLEKLPSRLTPDAYSKEFVGHVVPYDFVAEASLQASEPPYPLIKTIVPSWDNDARRPNRGLSLEEVSPKKYENWLTELVRRAIERPILGTPIVAINAWNEWAEGAYLEPDVYFGASYLNATARAVVRAREEAAAVAGSKAARAPVSVILPNYNHEKYLPERIRSIVRQTVPPDEIIFLDDCSSDNSVAVARQILSASGIPFQIVVNEKNSGGVFRQWMKGLSLARNDLVWIAETDDAADARFLEHILPAFDKEIVRAAYGYITCIDQDGRPRNDLEGYYYGLRDFQWQSPATVPAHQAFARDFAIKNVIPNASGLVFRRPELADHEVQRLYEYRFAGDWYFYALIARGGAIAYRPEAKSYFRINQSSASRSSFFTDRHLAEHAMVVGDISREYGVSGDVLDAHAAALAVYLPDRTAADVRAQLQRGVVAPESRALRICIAAHSFEVGGGEVLPLELANELKARGIHVTYLVVERDGHDGIRQRLRSDIPVLCFHDIKDRFNETARQYGWDIINSHNVSLEGWLQGLGVKVEIPYVASLHGGYETVTDRLTPPFIQFLNDSVTRWLYLADKNRKVVVDRGVLPDRFRHSFNAVAPYRGKWVDREAFRKEHNIPADAFVLVLCSRAIPEKGWGIAIRAVEALQQPGGRPVHLVLIGDGPAAAELRQACAGASYVHFLGQIDQPIRTFRCCDMGVFPSTYSGETFPLFMLECFQAGLPVVGSDIGEIPRIFGPSLTERPGVLLDHRLPAEALLAQVIEAVRGIAGSQAIYDVMCDNARKTSERFTVGALADLYLATFAELTGRGSVDGASQRIAA